MIRSTLAVALAVLAIHPVLAQENADSATTATALSTTATTASPGAEDSVSTGAQRGEGRRNRMAGMNFEARWERTQQTYKDAGLSDEKIQQLKALEKRVYDGMQSGEKVDYAAIRDERNKILTPEDQTKLREARQKMMERLRNNSGAAATTGTANQ